MGIKIGEQSEASFLEHPLGLLYSCHRRVTSFLNTMAAVTETAQGGELNEDQRQGLISAMRYFREAAPKHTQDEEDSLFPRLKMHQNPTVQDLMSEMEGLKQGHRDAESDHRLIDLWIQQWLDKGALTADIFLKLSDRLKHLSGFYQAHIQVEETQVFPLAEKYLTLSEKEAIGREMAFRRGLDPDALKQLTEDLKRPSV